MNPHIIRLRRPWEMSIVGSDASERVDVPEPQVHSFDAGAVVQYRRRFNRPAGLQHPSVVRLKISDWTGQLVSVLINGQAMEPVGRSVDADITSALQRQNQIDVRLRAVGADGVALSGEVTLQIS